MPAFAASGVSATTWYFLSSEIFYPIISDIHFDMRKKHSHLIPFLWQNTCSLITRSFYINDPRTFLKPFSNRQRVFNPEIFPNIYPNVLMKDYLVSTAPITTEWASCPFLNFIQFCSPVGVNPFFL